MSNPVARQKILKYSQQHFSAEYNTKLAAMGLKLPDSDGIVHFWTESLDDLLAVLTSKFYLGVVAVDEDNFFRKKIEKFAAYLRTRPHLVVDILQ